MNESRRAGALAALAILGGLVGQAPWVRAAGKVEAGAYCPLPPKGEKPKCLVPAQAEYADFFAGLEAGRPTASALGRIERDVADGASSERAFLALSSFAYGYYRMAQSAAADPAVDPELILRLERWNELLAAAYESSADAPSYRDAVRAAALDLHERTPPLGLRCLDAAGAATTCDSTEAVLRRVALERERTGVRGALGGLIERAFGAETQPVTPP